MTEGRKRIAKILSEDCENLFKSNAANVANVERGRHLLSNDSIPVLINSMGQLS
jgi:hypothetical protein